MLNDWIQETAFHFCILVAVNVLRGSFFAIPKIKLITNVTQSKFHSEQLGKGKIFVVNTVVSFLTTSAQLRSSFGQLVLASTL